MRRKRGLIPASLILLLALAALAAVPEARAAPPCCAITAINARTGMVTAKETATGRAFQFQVKDAALLKSLKVGQKFDVDVGALKVGQPFAANFGTYAGKMRLYPQPCCILVSLPQSSTALPPVQTAPSVATALMPKTNFVPKVHGFEFTNYFTGDILVGIPGIGTVNLGTTTYGLCGGMIFAAYDTFNLGAVAPDVPTTPPPSGTPMRSYIYGRQMDSLKYDNWFLVQKLIKWMRKPLNDNTVPNPLAEGGVNVIERGLIHLSGKQFSEKIRPQLDAGGPVTIVLVKASGEDMLSDPKAAFSKNHQVLAIGYHRHGDEWDIDVYDPNFRNTIQTLHVDGRYQTQKGSTAHTGGFRGFFRAPYKLERPPWVQDSPAVAGRVKSFPVVSLGRPNVDD